MSGDGAEEGGRDPGVPEEGAAGEPVYNLENRTLRQATPGLSCDLCGGPVLDRHCKVVCLNCGFIRDCSDP